ncbi:hypothetical protein GCM10011338_07690 [Alteromonas lipolytica]|nr:hypothetical protein GCM10011338_07690 [Alteromonas lipolytica]
MQHIEYREFNGIRNGAPNGTIMGLPAWFLCEKINSIGDSVVTRLFGLVDSSSHEQLELAKFGCTILTATILRTELMS